MAETLKTLGITDLDGKASLGQLSDNGSDFGDVDYLQFDDDEEDEFKNLKGGFIDLRTLGKQDNKASIDKKMTKYFEHVIGHEVKDQEKVGKRFF